MSKQNEHGKLIAAAAKAALLPLGCRRKGQSRCWFSDERFWYIFIEFQPSAWSKGTYLNVTPIWLFLQPWGGEAAHRVGDYIQFESVDQFGPLIEKGAQLIASEVIALRAKFRTLADLHRILCWQSFLERKRLSRGHYGRFGRRLRFGARPVYAD
jgi:hypothetical protein